jgi:hypothetical protein
MQSIAQKELEINYKSIKLPLKPSKIARFIHQSAASLP